MSLGPAAAAALHRRRRQRGAAGRRLVRQAAAERWAAHRACMARASDIWPLLGAREASVRTGWAEGFLGAGTCSRGDHELWSVCTAGWNAVVASCCRPSSRSGTCTERTCRRWPIAAQADTLGTLRIVVAAAQQAAEHPVHKRSALLCTTASPEPP